MGNCSESMLDNYMSISKKCSLQRIRHIEGAHFKEGRLDIWQLDIPKNSIRHHAYNYATRVLLTEIEAYSTNLLSTMSTICQARNFLIFRFNYNVKRPLAIE